MSAWRPGKKRELKKSNKKHVFNIIICIRPPSPASRTIILLLYTLVVTVTPAIRSYLHTHTFLPSLYAVPNKHRPVTILKRRVIELPPAAGRHARTRAHTHTYTYRYTFDFFLSQQKGSRTSSLPRPFFVIGYEQQGGDVLTYLKQKIKVPSAQDITRVRSCIHAGYATKQSFFRRGCSACDCSCNTLENCEYHPPPPPQKVTARTARDLLYIYIYRSYRL